MNNNQKAMDKISAYFEQKYLLDATKEERLQSEKDKVKEQPLAYTKAFLKSKDNLLTLQELQALLTEVENVNIKVVKATADLFYTNEFANKNFTESSKKIEAVKTAEKAIADSLKETPVSYFNENLKDALEKHRAVLKKYEEGKLKL